MRESVISGTAITEKKILGGIITYRHLRWASSPYSKSQAQGKSSCSTPLAASPHSLRACSPALCRPPRGKSKRRALLSTSMVHTHQFRSNTRSRSAPNYSLKRTAAYRRLCYHAVTRQRPLSSSVSCHVEGLGLSLSSVLGWLLSRLRESAFCLVRAIPFELVRGSVLVVFGARYHNGLEAT